jgi:tRNA-binding protein
MLLPGITIDDLKKCDIRVGIIRFVEPVDGSDKLLRCLVEIGDDAMTEEYVGEDGVVFRVRQIVSGIKQYFPNFKELEGQSALYIVNLEPRTIKGVVSNGMLLAVGDDDCVLLQPHKPVAGGSQIH